MKKRYKIVLNVDVIDPDKPHPSGGDYTHRTRIDGIVRAITGMYLGFDAKITLDKVIDKGVINAPTEAPNEEGKL